MPRPGTLASSPDALYSKFELFLNSIRRKGSRGPLSARQAPGDYYYFPEAPLQNFFADHLKHIVQSFLPSHVDDRLLRKDYAIVSAILLGLKRGPDIFRFLGKPGFSDSRLPFGNRSAFVNLVGDEAFFDDFYQYQWKFCAPKLELSWGRDWEPERILPFEILSELGHGAGGRTYLIKLDHEYNSLDEGSQVDAVDHDERHDLFVLKTLDLVNANEHRRELYTYVSLLRDMANNNITSIIRFYGSYTQVKTFNIVLEYADKGSLEKFLQENDPPIELEDVRIFWKCLMELFKALIYLHNLSEGGICHHDIAPRNILVSSRNLPSLYAYSFKLADFDISRPMKRIGSESQGRAAPGTRTYGAPESFPPPDFHGKLQVGPLVDIWSFGCVLSEVATWLIHGREGLEHYRNLRTKSHNVNFRDSDNFHNGLDVLPCVPAHHESLRSQRSDDTITQNILTLVDSFMLKPKDQRRDARDLWMMTFGHGSIFESTPNAIDFPPSKLSGILTNPQDINAKPVLLLGLRKKSPTNAVSTSTHKRKSVTNLIDKRNNGSSIHDGHGSDTASEQHLINIPSNPLHQNNSQSPLASHLSSHSPSPPLPDWPMKLLHEWRDSRASLPEGYWIADLKDRKYVFLVDDSTSMIQYWPEVDELLHSLAYVVKKFSHNGLELRYTHVDEKVHSSNSTDLVHSVRKHKPPYATGNDIRYTDIETSLGRFLDDYRDRIEEYANGRISRYFYHEVKRVNVYVLTDGRWQPESDASIEESLHRLVSTLKRHGKNPKQIGIQFIQFGDDPDARKCLERLDSGLGLGAYDIVDTEPSVGNGFKILLGAINKWADRSNEIPSPSALSDPGNSGMFLAG